MISWT